MTVMIYGLRIRYLKQKKFLVGSFPIVRNYVFIVSIQKIQRFRLLYQPNSQSVLQPFGDPDDILHRLEEFFKLFLSDGLNSEFSYQFGLKNV